MPPGAREPGDVHVLDLVRPLWPPLRHVQRGWASLTAAERAAVAARIEAVRAAQGPLRGNRDALARFFTFLAQVETIAIEIPLRALPTAPARLRPLLRRQLCDEVVHSAVFARLAHELSLPAHQPPEPLASAERLLDRIRQEPDMAVGAALLNLVAEAWIETIFRHARAWGVADAVFAAVLEDESRHVEEAHAHMGGLDPAAALPAVRALERGLLEVGGEASVALAMMDLAGADAYRRLADDLHDGHARQLAAIGLAPDPAFAELRRLRDETPGAAPAAPAGAGASATKPRVPQPVPVPVPDTPWREQARALWSTPRDPTMQGSFDVRVGHIPRKLLTPVLVAAIGRAWAANPRLNRVVSRGRVWQLPGCSVGVRVLVADDELATVVIPDADQRSVRDIQRMLGDGHRQLTALRERRLRMEAAGTPRPKADPAVEELLPPGAASFSVALSNPGRFGLVEGAGSFSGALAPSTDLTVGQRRRLPAWHGVAYLPAWHVSLGCLQDHRVFDGREAGLAMSALREQLGRRGVRAILAAEDTLPDVEPPAYDDAWFAALPPPLRLMPMVGMWKYTPLVVGGAALGAALGYGGYLLYQNVAGAGAAGAAAAAAAGAAPPAGAASAAPAAAAASRAGLCQAIIAGGEPCPNPASGGAFCVIHGGQA